MRLTDYAASLALLGSTAVSAFGRHAAHQGLLQIPPAFAKDGINLYPGLHPDHDHTDLNHLIPEGSKRMHFSQEGHRPALHGAKHAHLEATFSHPTVILEHSSHIQDVVCSNGYIKTCFNTREALSTVERSWKKEMTSDVFNLITYHINCGHLTGERRSFFHASKPSFKGDCVTVEVDFIDEKEAIHAGDLAWGTYSAPNLAKRQPVRGHVRVSKPQEDVVDGSGGSETVNINEDAAALHAFFGDAIVNTDIPDSGTEGGGFLKYEGDLVKRGFFSWVINAIKSLINLVEERVQQTLELIQTVAKVMVAIAATAVNLLLVPFGFPFNQEYHADISFKRYVDPRFGIGSDLVTTVTNIIANVAVSSDDAEAVYSGQGGSIFVSCAQCGAKGNFTFDGKLAFSISEGLTKAQVSLINNEPFVIEAIFGLKTQGRALPTGKEVTNNKGKKSTEGFRTTISKQLPAVPLTPLYIPGLLTIGPQLVVEPAASVYIDATANIKTGPRFTVSPGNLTLDAKNPGNNVAYGWEPEFDWVFEIDGNVVATADLALQIGIEVALDVLTGTFKTAAGIYTAPSVYFTAEYSKKQGKECDGGVELRLGAKNRVYSSVFGLREYEFKQLGTTFADKGLGCIGPDGSWDTSKVGKPKFLDGAGFNSGIGKELSDLFNNQLATDKSINVTEPERIELGDKHAEAEKHKNEFGTAQKMPQTHGFRVIQDANQTGILVSGKDGRIYMTDNSGDYDISAPWGAIDVTKEKYSYDVFGRLIYFNSSRWNNIEGAGKVPGLPLGIGENTHLPNLMLEMGVASSEKIPKGVSDASLMAINAEDGVESFALALNGSGLASYSDQWVWLPTLCQIPRRGLQLFASNYIVNGDGSASFPGGFPSDDAATKIYRRDFTDLGLDRLPGSSGKVSKSDVKKLTELFGKDFKPSKGIRGYIKSERKKTHSRSDLRKKLKSHHAEDTEANIKTLEEILRNQYQSCRTVRLISNLKNSGIVSNLIGDVAKVGDAAVDALGTAL